jgi:hypothetical protein
MGKCDNSSMSSSKNVLHDKALADLKLIFQILNEMHDSSSKVKIQIFDNALRFSIQELVRSIHLLNEIAPDALLMEKSAFLTPVSAVINISVLQPKLLLLQKYLLATLL